MPKEFEQTYIGDGVYARWDGMSVLLETERDNGKHYIYLEPQHVENIVRLMKEPLRFTKDRRMADAAQIIAENARCSRCGAKLDGSDECSLADCPHV